MSVPIPIPPPCALCPACLALPYLLRIRWWGGRFTAKKKNKTEIQRNRRKQCKEANRLPRLPRPPPPFLLCLSVRPLGEAAAEAKFQFRGYCIFSQPLSRRGYTLCTADCMWWGSLFLLFALVEVNFFLLLFLRTLLCIRLFLLSFCLCFSLFLFLFGLISTDSF